MTIPSKNLLRDQKQEVRNESTLTTTIGRPILQPINRPIDTVSPMNLNEIFGSLQKKPICCCGPMLNSKTPRNIITEIINAKYLN